MRVLFNCDYLKFQNLEEDANWIQGSAIHQFVIISLLITKHMFNTPKVIAYYKKPLSHPLGFFAIKYQAVTDCVWAIVEWFSINCQPLTFSCMCKYNPILPYSPN